MLVEVVTEVFATGFPVDEEMVLANAVAYPIESHVHCTRWRLAYG